MSQNTVFVIGAGASEEANLPTGYELKETISRLLDFKFDSTFRDKTKSGDETIIIAFWLLADQLFDQVDGSTGNIVNSYVDEARHIREALPQAISIDNFIDTRRDNYKIAQCGKLAIVRSILEAEKNCLLHFERKRTDSIIDFKDLEETWYTPFFQLITQNCVKNDLKERFKSITLIIFNYDRCIEHFIYYALQNYYNIPGTEAADLVKNINIYHPYGDVGTLPWINEAGAVAFGEYLRPENLLLQSSKINTFVEGTDPGSSKILEIRKHMGRANKLVFLGFAFHPLNMQLITPKKRKGVLKGIKCFATTFNISDSNKKVIKDQICDMYPGPNQIVEMSDLKCYAFFSEYWRNLSF
jgi:hypothetical protein